MLCKLCVVINYLFEFPFVQEHTAPNTQVIEEVGLSPIITSPSTDQRSSITVTLTLSSTNFCQPHLTSSTIPIHHAPAALVTYSTTQDPSSSVPPITTPLQTNITSLLTTGHASSPPASVVGGAPTPLSRTQPQMESSSAVRSTTPVRTLPVDSHQRERPGVSSRVPSLPSANAGAITDEPQNAEPLVLDLTCAASNDQGIHHDGSAFEDSHSNDPGEDDDDDDDDDDDVIVLPGSTPRGRNRGMSTSALLDSGEDFQESPLPKTPRKSAKKKAVPQGNRKKGIPETKKGPSSLTKASPRERISRNKEIVTRSKSSTRGDKNSTSSHNLSRPAGRSEKPQNISKPRQPGCTNPVESTNSDTLRKRASKLSTSDGEPSSSTKARKPDPKPPRPLTRATGNRISTSDVIISQGDGSSPAGTVSKAQKHGRKRPLGDDNGDKDTAPSPRKKARSSEPHSPSKDANASEIALHTRGLNLITIHLWFDKLSTLFIV